MRDRNHIDPWEGMGKSTQITNVCHKNGQTAQSDDVCVQAIYKTIHIIRDDSLYLYRCIYFAKMW